MTTCEYRACNNEKTCFHYCAIHHEMICAGSAIIDMKQCGSTERRNGMSALDDVLFAGQGYSYCECNQCNAARVELAVLRAAVAERDAAIEQAVQAEREACIAALDDLPTGSDDEFYTIVAAKAVIRARSKVKP